MKARAERFAGRKIIVTGGASGIGQALATLLCAQGARVAILDNNAAAAKELAATLGALAVEVDISNAMQVSRAVSQVADALGGIDGLANVAGASMVCAFEDLKEEAWDRTMAVNLKGTFLMTQAVLPHLRESPTASIVNMSSAIALSPLPMRSAYTAAKGGIIALTKALALELGPQVRVNVVCPGAIDTPMSQATHGDPQVLAQAQGRYALKRFGTADEVASAIGFLLSAESSFTTGTVLTVDGGRTYH